ncbi:related to TRM11-Catalytic subunit of an adoMet-dependent tRNA [Sporisorium scitamineum]|uniref:tRNA (guanine(10)-N(2))-methyltransferase n=1 Tax=Sporisorium scitamineum TaxID=49012 RepID=A0A127ZJ41_9BASI|nr:related to TRM11-Catalytic subunit of an adoMet-dependent tRNA [Sporisorium scitamineum]
MVTCFPPVEDPASIGPLYILHFATSNHAFRLPDFLAAAEYLGIPFAFVPTPANSVLEECRKENDASEQASSSSYRPDLRRPFALAHLPNDEAAINLLRRCVSLRSIWAHWSHGGSYDELHARNQQESSRALWAPYVEEADCPSWKAHVFSYSYTISDKRKIDIIQSFSYMDMKGRIQLKNPSMRWGVMEEFVAQELWPSHLRDEHNNYPGAGKDTDKAEGREELGDKDPRLVQIFLGRRIDVKAGPLYSEKATPAAPRKSSDPTQEGQTGLARDLIEKLNLKKRVYIGNTSMESEMSLLMASMALAGPGKLIYDPFAGTGSMLYASAVFGAMAFGSDIDGRPMRGKENISDSNSKTGIIKSAAQYGVRDHILDTVVFDMTQNPWRKDLLFPVNGEEAPQTDKRPKGVVDGIVADPPYGVRAGAKRLGKRDPEKQRTEAYWMPDGLGPGQGCWSHERSDYISPTRPYHLEDLVNDLLDYAYSLLCDGGRLVFWLPSMIDPEGDEENDSGENTGYTKSSAAIERSVSIELPQHRRPAGQGRMRMIHYSLQDFGRWGRWLITMEKVSPENDVDDEGLRELEQRMGELGKNKDERGIYRADRDPLEFRNRYYLPRVSKPSQ